MRLFIRPWLFGILLLFAGGSVFGQTRSFSAESVDYAFELPSPGWRLISQPGDANQHAEFINGDRLNGYLQVRREVVDAETAPTDLLERDRDQRLQFLPGFVPSKSEPFAGNLNGVVFSYDYVRTGKPMLGRIYYLAADKRTIYSLRFTGLKDKLTRIRNQTDLIARTFRLK
jgi:hypothetical protein